MPPSHGSGLFAPGSMSALQKYKVKEIDLFSVTVTNSSLGERAGNKKLELQLQLKNMKTLRRISKHRAFTHVRILTAVVLVLAAAALVFLAVSPPAAAQPTAHKQPLTPRFSAAVAFDVSPALRSLARIQRPRTFAPDTILEVRQERGPEGPQAHGVKGHNADGVLQLFNPAPTIPAPLLTFEGMSNQDNFNIFGFRVNPPDPNGEVGPNNYVEMINLVFAVYDKAGNLLVGPIDTGSLWSGFAVTDCTDPSGDPVVLYDQFMRADGVITARAPTAVCVRQ